MIRLGLVALALLALVAGGSLVDAQDAQGDDPEDGAPESGFLCWRGR